MCHETTKVGPDIVWVYFEVHAALGTSFRSVSPKPLPGDWNVVDFFTKCCAASGDAFRRCV